MVDLSTLSLSRVAGPGLSDILRRHLQSQTPRARRIVRVTLKMLELTFVGIGLLAVITGGVTLAAISANETEAKSN